MGKRLKKVNRKARRFSSLVIKSHRDLLATHILESIDDGGCGAGDIRSTDEENEGSGLTRTNDGCKVDWSAGLKYTNARHILLDAAHILH